jgi:hypothetical protein
MMRRITFFLAAGGSVGLLSLGIHRGEFVDTLRNAALICLACIGIG